MADPACGIQNRRDFLSASPRAGRQGRGSWGELEPGAQLESRGWGDCSSHPLPGWATSLLPGAHSSPPPPPRGPWCDCFPSSLGGPPERATAGALPA